MTPLSVLDEDRLSLDEAAKLLPGRGAQHVSRQTVRRWCVTGVKVGVRRVKLEARRVGDSWWTSKQAIDRWLAALNPTEVAPPPIERTPTQASRASKKAERELIRRGC